MVRHLIWGQVIAGSSPAPWTIFNFSKMNKPDKIKLLLLQTNSDISSQKEKDNLLRRIRGVGHPELIKKMMERFDEIVKQYSIAQRAAYEVYNDVELDFLIRFYGTELGRSIIRKEKSISEKVFSAYTKITMAELKRAQEELDGGNPFDGNPHMSYSYFATPGFMVDDDNEFDEDDEDDDDPDIDDFLGKFGLDE